MPAIDISSRDDRDRDLVKGGSKLVNEANYATASHVRTHFAEVIDASRRDGTKTLITEHSRPAAAVVPVVEFRILQLFEKAGLIEKLSELTYRDIPVDEALVEISEIVNPQNVPSLSGSGESEDVGDDSSIQTKRGGVAA